MAKVDTLQMLVDFTTADLEYLRLLRQALEIHEATGHAISVEDWHAIADARKAKDDLERRIHAVLRNHNGTPPVHSES